MAHDFHYMTDEKWASLTREEQNASIRAETDALMHACEFIAAGLAVRRAGLIYFLPLCHDSYGAGAG